MDGSEAAGSSNGQAAPPAEQRVRFGDRASQTVPSAWAELILRRLRAQNPRVFAAMLTYAATADDDPAAG